MVESHRKDILGIVGGMGPLASAEFLKTIYEYSINEREQESPVVVMYSDPTFPDRTEMFLEGLCDVLLDQLIEVLHYLCNLGASRIVICCITIHHLLPRLPYDLRRRIVSLLDVIFANVLQLQKKHLLICTNGTRKLNIFQSHSQWKLLKDYIVLPDENDQNMIHDFIYQVKKNRNIRELIPFLDLLLSKYKIESFIAGCTEMHLLAKHLIFFSDNQKGYGCVDPLTIIAKEVGDAST